jgi:cyclopropane-fatty-acyl-phospholipid synthase
MGISEGTAERSAQRAAWLDFRGFTPSPEVKMFAHTAPLRDALKDALPKRPFTVRFWDGTQLASTERGGPTFTIRSPRALAHILRSPGELGLGRAYAAGLIDVDDMDAGLLLVDTFEPPALSPRTLLRLGAALIRATGLQMPPPIPASELRLRGERHTLARDRKAVRHHYDAGNDFFALFLDDSMTYTCGCYKYGATTLEQAQEAKLEMVCRKLALKPGERLLDVGCGWGGLAVHAATRHGIRVLGVTLSEPQAQLARDRVAAAGVADLVEIRVADYRELDGERFDAISSIEMVEAVGEERVDLYASILAGMLGPGGRVLNQGISKLKDFDTPDEGAFSERYVFPDGVPLPLSRMTLALERAGLITQDVEGFADDYAETLTHWIDRYERRYDEAVALAGEERARVWRLFLYASRQAFVTDWASVYQVLAHRPPAPKGAEAVVDQTDVPRELEDRNALAIRMT